MLRRGEGGVADPMGVGEHIVEVKMIGSGALRVRAIIRVVVEEMIEELLSLLDLVGEGEKGGVLGSDVAGELDTGVLEVEDLLELGDGFEELGLEGGEEGEDLFGGGGRGGKRKGRGRGRREEGRDGAAEGGKPEGAVGADLEEARGEGGHEKEEGLSARERRKEREERRGGWRSRGEGGGGRGGLRGFGGCGGGGGGGGVRGGGNGGGGVREAEPRRGWVDRRSVTL